jgi:hypothetical protein
MDDTTFKTSVSNVPLQYCSPEQCTGLQLHLPRLQLPVNPTSRVLPPRAGGARQHRAAGLSKGLQDLFSFKNMCNPSAVCLIRVTARAHGGFLILRPRDAAMGEPRDLCTAFRPCDRVTGVLGLQLTMNVVLPRVS